MTKRKVLSLSLNESEMEKIAFLISEIKKEIGVESLTNNVSDSACVKIILEQIYNEKNAKKGVA